jgi:enoyl-CoA hydratase/carnithine racemase
LHQKLLTPAPLKGVLWLQGAGERAFCAGGDVASIQKQVVQRQGSIPSDFFFEEYHLDYDLAALPGLVQVSVWNGVTMGGGVGLSIHGRFRVATERTVFSMPETGIGFFPDVGTTHALPRLRAGPEVGLYLALTGSRLGPGDCLLTGVATHYVPSARLERVKAELQALQDATPDMVHEVLAGAAADSGRDVKATLEPHLDAIRRCFSRPTAEQILQALKVRRPPRASFSPEPLVLLAH